MKTKVINLFAGSGSGKSTTAALVYGAMKQQGYNIELVREFVKSWAWEGRKIEPSDQITVLGNQIQLEKILYGKVDYIVTDSPLLLCGFYTEHFNKYTHMTQGIKLIIEDYKDRVEYINFFVNRTKKFDPRGRYETEDQAKAIDGYLKNYLDRNDISYYTLTQDDSTRHLEILQKIKELND